jgi:hypothetical protein
MVMVNEQKDGQCEKYWRLRLAGVHMSGGVESSAVGLEKEKGVQCSAVQRECRLSEAAAACLGGDLHTKEKLQSNWILLSWSVFQYNLWS